MEIKNKLEFKSVANEKEVYLQCDRDCPLGMLHDFLHEMLAFVVQKISEESEKVDNKAAEEKDKPEEKSEPEEVGEKE